MRGSGPPTWPNRAFPCHEWMPYPLLDRSQKCGRFLATRRTLRWRHSNSNCRCGRALSPAARHASLRRRASSARLRWVMLLSTSVVEGAILAVFAANGRTLDGWTARRARPEPAQDRGDGRAAAHDHLTQRFARHRVHQRSIPIAAASTAAPIATRGPPRVHGVVARARIRKRSGEDAAPALLDGNSPARNSPRRSPWAARPMATSPSSAITASPARARGAGRKGHPVGIVTKSNLAPRDLDVLADRGLRRGPGVRLGHDRRSPLSRRMETRAGRPPARAIEMLAQAGVPVGVMAAPIIPAVNDGEIRGDPDPRRRRAASAKRATSRCACRSSCARGFREWLAVNFPDKFKRAITLDSVDARRQGLHVAMGLAAWRARAPTPG